jgi:ferric-dicitrate binding protein FerR (iron transport regulator)
MASDDERTHRLLEEIRDAQREHLAEYRRVTQQSLELQQRAVSRQAELGRLYRRIVVLGGSLIVVLMALLIYLLVHWSRYLFR